MRMALVFAVVAALVVAAPAASTTGSGNQNPDLAVTVSLTPDEVSVGQTATATSSVTNRSSRRQAVTIVYSLTVPSGQVFSASETVTLRPGEALTRSASYTRDGDEPNGTYTLTVSATDRNGTSTASAATQYV